jgi:hypothetical protein
VTNIGTGSCGFEQQLEAALKAVTPSTEWTAIGYVPPRFLDTRGMRDGDAGQGDGPNAGFLRASSVLALLLLTDEEDCSVSDYSLFVSSEPRFSAVPLNLRCWTFGDDSMDVVYPIDRYVAGLRALRLRPEHLVFAAIAGIPPEVEPPLGTVTPNFDAILSHPDMEPRPNVMRTNLEPSCSTTNGIADAPVRIVRVAEALASAGAGVSLSSICTSDYGVAVGSVLQRIGARLPPL